MTNLDKNLANESGQPGLIEILKRHSINPEAFAQFLDDSIETSREILEISKGLHRVDEFIRMDIQLTNVELFKLKLENELLDIDSYEN